MQPPRSPAPAVMSAVAFVVLILGVWPNWWFSGEMKTDNEYLDDTDMSMSLGLREISVCAQGHCGSVGYSSMPSELNDSDAEEAKAFKRFVWAGGATFWCGMVCGVAMLTSLLLWLMRQRLAFSVPTVAGALGVVTAVGGTIALLMRPKFPGGEMMQFELNMSVGYPLCLLGGIGCAVGGFMMAKEEKGFVPFGQTHAYAGQPYYGGPGPVQYGQQPPYPGQPGYGQQAYGAPPPQVSPACPRCSAPTMFVAEHQRYFCSSCRAYL